MRKLAIAILCFAVLAVSAPAMAEPPSVRASITPDTVLIGDRFSLEVVIEKDMMQVVSLPSFDDNRLVETVEIVSESPLDTLRQEGRRQTLLKVYELASFDAGAYDMGRYPVLYGDKNIIDTLYSPDNLRIVVNTLPVDTEGGTVYDIKSPEQAPLLVSEIAGYVVASFVAALVVAALVLLAVRLIRSRKRGTEPGEAVSSVPPHLRAIEELESLQNRKLWQSGKIKAYYTALTDILRQYVRDRYGIDAPEMTSEEIMRAVGGLALSDKSEVGLRELLLTADLVKFAKYAPGPEVNENLYYTAYYFVEDTKLTPEEEFLAGEENSENDGK